MTAIFTITLPSFLRRVLRAYALKAQIRSFGCDLQRIGRSRNWQIKASFEQLEEVIASIEQAEEPSWLWVAKHLSNHKGQLNFQELTRIASLQKDISVNQLMARTDCTLADARRVIDKLEGLDD